MRNQIPDPLLSFSSLLLVLISLLAACTSDAELPAQVAESYVNALAEKDLGLLVQSSCSSWELGARLEMDAFTGVETRVEGLACSVASQDDQSATVTCSGAIVAAYGAEDRSFPLDGRVFRLQREGGTWLVCGTE